MRRLGLKVEKEGSRKLLGYGPLMPSIKWGDINIEELNRGYCEIRIRTEKASKPFRTVYIPAKWDKKPENWSLEKWDKMVRLEKGILGIIDSYHSEQERFNHVKPEDELFQFTEKTAMVNIKKWLGYSSHYLRHSRISHGSGRFTPDQLEDQAGHSSLEMTSRYLHFDKEDFVSRF